MKKRDAIQKGIDNLPAHQLTFEEKRRAELEKKKDDARPALLKRMGAGLLDLIFSAAVAAGLFAIAYFAFFEKIGYQGASSTMMDVYQHSGLYVTSADDSRFVQLPEKYNSELSPEKNYDEPITNFYTTNARAVREEMNIEYIQRKVASNYYIINDEGDCVRKAGISEEVAKAYLEKEYYRAVDYLFNDPIIVNATRLITYTVPITVLIVSVISFSIFYFTIPLLDKKKRTLAYMIFKIMPVTSEELVTPVNSKIFFRSLMYVTLNYISIITIGFILGGITYSFIPFLINTVCISFSRSNSGLYDFGTKIIVINESRSNAISSLQQIAGKGE